MTLLRNLHNISVTVHEAKPRNLAERSEALDQGVEDPSLARDDKTGFSREQSQIPVFLLIGLFMLCSLVLTACSAPEHTSTIERLNAINRPFDLSDAPVTDTEDVAAQQAVQLNIVSIGDIIFHHPWMQEYDSAGVSIYPEYFRNINDITQEADLALCNVEGPIAGGELSGYPMFNFGDSIAPAVSEAGFDVVYTSHNHMLDQYSEGALRTLEVLRGSNLHTTGSRLSEDEPNYAMVTVKGVQVAVIAYTYESSEGMINGLPIPAGMDSLLNSYLPGSLDDLNEMKTVVESARSAGAELVIFYLHAGTEYQHEVDGYQRSTAAFLVEQGVDVIFGSHVHVVQTMEMMYPLDGSAPTPVYWGMGNYISSQIEEGGMALENEEGVMAQLSLTWNPATSEIDAFTMDYLPLWTCYDPSSERLMYTTIADRGDISENSSIQATGKYQRALNAFAEVRAIMGEQITWKREA